MSSGLACASHTDALTRGQRYYEDNQYERALALWRDLDRRGAEFRPAERARYAYFRGMTDYRLGYRDDARHWLAIARASEAAHPGALGPVWLDRLDGALTDLARGAWRAGGGGPDAIQTIEAPPGAALPRENSEEGDDERNVPGQRSPGWSGVAPPPADVPSAAPPSTGDPSATAAGDAGIPAAP